MFGSVMLCTRTQMGSGASELSRRSLAGLGSVRTGETGRDAAVRGRAAVGRAAGAASAGAGAASERWAAAGTALERTADVVPAHATSGTTSSPATAALLDPGLLTQQRTCRVAIQTSTVER
ncbi:MAG: hypothetical protein ACR2JU_07285 [Nocardioidaceae bacterium]